LIDIEIDWAALKADEIYPQTIPDLFVGRPVILAGRFEGIGHSTIRITGKAGRNKMELSVPVESATGSAENAAFPPIWARMKVADLSDRALWSPNPFLPAQIKKLALDYNLMSPYTAFLAVDSSARTTGEFGTTVPVPVPVPDGVRYDTTVSE
jgi:Ca-activated chloride channel family protein